MGVVLSSSTLDPSGVRDPLLLALLVWAKQKEHEHFFQGHTEVLFWSYWPVGGPILWCFQARTPHHHTAASTHGCRYETGRIETRQKRCPTAADVTSIWRQPRCPVQFANHRKAGENEPLCLHRWQKWSFIIMITLEFNSFCFVADTDTRQNQTRGRIFIKGWRDKSCNVTSKSTGCFHGDQRGQKESKKHRRN